jgi:hypothetical protein
VLTAFGAGAVTFMVVMYAFEHRHRAVVLKTQEGEFVPAEVGFQAATGHEAPVVHFDADEPLRPNRDGRILSDGP